MLSVIPAGGCTAIQHHPLALHTPLNMHAVIADVGSLTSLSKLVIAGNCLPRLPDTIASLKTLDGLWVHGNLITTLPDSIGTLTQLKQLSLAGGLDSC